MLQASFSQSSFAADYSEPTSAPVGKSIAGTRAFNGNPQQHQIGFGNSEGSQRAAFFDIAATGKSIIFVLDASASMGLRDAWRVACAELCRSIASFPADTKFQILLYDNQPRVLLPAQPGWLHMNPETYAQIRAALAAQRVEGNTNHVPAMQKALAQRPDVVFLLTDADDLDVEQLRRIQLANRNRAVIHTIELNMHNRQRTGMPLQRLARINEGQYRAIALPDY